MTSDSVRARGHRTIPYLERAIQTLSDDMPDTNLGQGVYFYIIQKLKEDLAKMEAL